MNAHLLHDMSYSEGLGGDESSTVIVMNKIDTLEDHSMLQQSSLSQVMNVQFLLTFVHIS